MRGILLCRCGLFRFFLYRRCLCRFRLYWFHLYRIFPSRWIRAGLLGLFVYHVLHAPKPSVVVPLAGAYDVARSLQLLDRFTDCVHALFADDGETLQRVIPFFRQGQHHRKQTL